MGRPRIRELDGAEIAAVLRRNNVGRIAYTLGDHVDIEPIHYVFHDGVLYGRTSPGTKLTSLWRDPVVAFEVDEVDGPLEWRSVVVHGAFHRVSADGPHDRGRAYDRAVEVLRRFSPEAFTPDDPFPDRTVVFRVPVQRATGRASRLESRASS